MRVDAYGCADSDFFSMIGHHFWCSDSSSEILTTNSGVLTTSSDVIFNIQLYFGKIWMLTDAQGCARMLTDARILISSA
jgi:hypothetical protein